MHTLTHTYTLFDKHILIEEKATVKIILKKTSLSTHDKKKTSLKVRIQY